jgi:predicted ribonuclease YlaK
VQRAKTYFVDTNFFEECRVPHELPWVELAGPVDHVHLIVLSTVIGEIDKHKKGNCRTARRARDASALFRRALEAGADHTIEIHHSKPRITLALPPVASADYAEYPHLDRTRRDHQIAAETATLARSIPACTLLSNDTNLVLAARSIGLPPALIPETWETASRQR